MKRAPEGHVRPPLAGLDKVGLVLATGFGAGLAPVASGTFGTLVAIPLYLALALLPLAAQVALTLAVIAASMWAAGIAGRYYGASDDGRIVVDEIAGFLVTMALVPPTLKSVAAGFLLFRLFDIVKPWPASYFDKQVHTGVGNVADDLCAAIYARIGVGVLLYFWP